ncbi:hypothetical protein Tco_0378107 [Tanacetum coccineum]
MGEGSINPTDPHHTPTIIQPSTSQPKKKQRPRKPKRKDTQIPQSSGPTYNVADEAVNEEMYDSLERAATTATSLNAELYRGNIIKTQSKAIPNKDGSQGTTSNHGGYYCSNKDSLKLNELMELCTNLQQRVLDLETTKTTQANEIASLKRRVKKLERRNKSRTHGLKRMYRVGSSRRVVSSKDKVNDQDDVDMFGVNDLDGDELVSVAKEIDNAAATTISIVSIIPVTDDEITLAQALAELKSAKPKDNKVVIQEPKHAMKRVNTFVDYKTELVEESSKKAEIEQAKAEISQERSSKRAREDLEHESSKKQKVEEDKESEELKQCLEIVSR